MNFKFLLVFFSAVMLAACGKPETDLAEVQVPIAPKASSTAIFLPGGGGIDFGFKPILNKLSDRDSKNRITRVIMFDFHSTLALESIKGSIYSVLSAQGYERKVRGLTGSSVYEESYHKNTVNPIYVRYYMVVKEGFNRKVQVKFAWYE